MSRYLVDQIERNETGPGLPALGGGRARRRARAGDGHGRRHPLRRAEPRSRQGAVRLHRRRPPYRVAEGPAGHRRRRAFCSPAATSRTGPRRVQRRRPLFLETSRPGIFAVGDVRSGSIKRVASAVGEGSMAVRLVHDRLAASNLRGRGQRCPPAPISIRFRSPSSPSRSTGCEECLATGDPWLHLRICLECGKVGCCDDSPNRHASAHAGQRPPADPLARAGRGVVLVLRRRLRAC